MDTERCRLILEHALEGFWDWDLIADRVFLSPRFVDMIGRSRDDVVTSAFFASLIHPDDREQVIEVKETYLQGERDTLVVVFRMIMADGLFHWTEGRGTLVAKDAHGRPSRMVGTVVDISERKEVEQSLRRDYEELEQLVEERTAQLLELNRKLERRIQERDQAQEAVLAQQANLDTMAVELALTEERGRRRIARELHDQVGQVLLLGRIKLGMLADATTSPAIEPMISEIKELIDSAIRDVRSLTFQLSPPLLSTVGLEAALEWLCKQLQESFGLQVTFSDDKLPKPISEEMRHVIFQAVRELLINVKKHAQVNEALLYLRRAENAIVIGVEDRGAGFVQANPGSATVGDRGYGLFNSRRRIEHRGGTLTLESTPGQGTRAVITIPVLSADH